MLDTYSDLKTALQEDLNRDDATDALLSRFVYFAEKQLSKRLKVREMQASAELTPTAGVVTLPDDFAGVRYVYADGAPLAHRTEPQALSLYPSALSGVASNYAVIGSTLKTYPQTSGTVTLGYWQEIPALSDSNTSNWLLAKSPELYLQAACVHGCRYFRDFEEMSVYANWVAAEIDALNEQDGSETFAFAMPDEGDRP